MLPRLARLPRRSFSHLLEVWAELHQAELEVLIGNVCKRVEERRYRSR